MENFEQILIIFFKNVNSLVNVNEVACLYSDQTRGEGTAEALHGTGIPATLSSSHQMELKRMSPKIYIPFFKGS